MRAGSAQANTMECWRVRDRCCDHAVKTGLCEEPWRPTVGRCDGTAAREQSATRTAWRRHQRKRQLQRLKEEARRLPDGHRRGKGNWKAKGVSSKDRWLLQQALALLRELSAWQPAASTTSQCKSKISAPDDARWGLASANAERKSDFDSTGTAEEPGVTAESTNWGVVARFQDKGEQSILSECCGSRTARTRCEAAAEPSTAEEPGETAESTNLGGVARCQDKGEQSTLSECCGSRTARTRCEACAQVCSFDGVWVLSDGSPPEPALQRITVMNNECFDQRGNLIELDLEFGKRICLGYQIQWSGDELIWTRGADILRFRQLRVQDNPIVTQHAPGKMSTAIFTDKVRTAVDSLDSVDEPSVLQCNDDDRVNTSSGIYTSGFSNVLSESAQHSVSCGELL